MTTARQMAMECQRLYNNVIRTVDAGLDAVGRNEIPRAQCQLVGALGALQQAQVKASECSTLAPDSDEEFLAGVYAGRCRERVNALRTAMTMLGAVGLS